MQGFGFSETQMVPALMTSIMVGCFGNPEVSKLGILCLCII
jgi:hypothetical protein